MLQRTHSIENTFYREQSAPRERQCEVKTDLVKEAIRLEQHQAASFGLNFWQE